MKKKMLSVLLAVCMLAAMLTTSMVAFAADAQAFKVDVQAAGKTVTVTITLPGSAKAAGANCTLQYDNTKLAFAKTVEQANGNMVNPNYRENAVRFSFAQPLATTTDTVMWKMEFTLKSGTVSANDFAVTAFKLYNENSELISSEATVNTAINFSCTHAQTTEKVTVQPTHTTAGTKAIVCAVCGETIKTESVPALGHSFGAWTVTKPATCTETGTETRTCSCGETETREIAKTAHTPGAWEVVTAPTCTEEGKKVQKCTVCGTVVKEEVVPATGHSFGEWVVVKDYTCTEDGLKERVCSVCGEKETEVLPAAHRLENAVVVKEPTCTEPGLKEGVCSVCGEKATEEIPALGHSFGEWTVVKEATETEEGLKERTCSVCGEKETQVIPKLEKEEPATEDANTPDIPQTSGRSIAYVVSSLAMLSMAAGVSVYAVNKKRKNK